MKKILVVILILLATFLIYKFSIDNRIYYVSIGDFLSKGINPYNEEGYGYSDYLKEYLEEKSKIKKYTKSFSREDYRIIDIINDINNNKEKDKLTIKQALDKADILTISIGSNDIFYKMGINDMNYNLTNINDGYVYIKEVLNDMNKLFKEVSKYSRADIYVLGYYNPLGTISSLYVKELEPLFMYANQQLEELANKYNYNYVEIYSIFKNDPSLIPNKSNVNPNNNGYKLIADKIIEKLK